MERVNTVGAGDTLAAGLAVGLLDGRPLLEAARLGIAAAAADVATPVPGAITHDAVQALLPRVGIRSLS